MEKVPDETEKYLLSNKFMRTENEMSDFLKIKKGWASNLQILHIKSNLKK